MLPHERYLHDIISDISPAGNLVIIRFRGSVTPPHQAACGVLVKVLL